MRGTLLGHQQPEPEPEMLVLAAVLKRAVRDARQISQPTLKQEALSFLWACAPDLAEVLSLPELRQCEAENGREWHTQANISAKASNSSAPD